LKLHANLVRAVADTLQRIFGQEQYADKAIEKTLSSNPSWGARDRAFIAETTYNIVRNWRLLTFTADLPFRTEEFWTVIAAYLVLREVELPNWTEFDGIRPKKIIDRYQEAFQIRKIRESVPDWLDERGEKELGDNWEPILAALNETAEVVLRANRLKIKAEELKQRLENEGIASHLLDGDALVLNERKNVFRTQLFKDGLFEVQDYSSQQVAQVLDTKAGMRVVDACAGAGGKSLHLAALMGNKGKIVSLDTEAWKLDELRLRARRAGAGIIETRLIESRKTIKRLYHSADRLLLDVPCSGLGVLRRNPDAKWKLQNDFIEKVQKIQSEILEQYSPICKVGGKIVYATCSILPSENQEQIRNFLEKQASNYQLLEEKAILPQDKGFDGFYMAVLERLK
jgi:16S rRNA (cytosine967-C5)-methyltransferase